MRLVLVDDEPRVLVNATLRLDDDLGDEYSYKNGPTLDFDIGEEGIRDDDAEIFAKFKVAIGYMGLTCMTTIFERMENLPTECIGSIAKMPDNDLADELTNAIGSLNAAYYQIKDHSPAVANALAKISVDIQNTYNAAAESEIRNESENLQIGQHVYHAPQPDGLSKTFMRQRPKETWLQTARRVLSEDGAESFQELLFNDGRAASIAAKEVLSLKEAIVVWSNKFSEGAVDELETSGKHNTAAAAAAAPEYSFIPWQEGNVTEAELDQPPQVPRGFISPLNATAKPFMPTTFAQSLSGSQFTAASRQDEVVRTARNIRPPPGFELPSVDFGRRYDAPLAAFDPQTSQSTYSYPTAYLGPSAFPNVGYFHASPSSERATGILSQPDHLPREAPVLNREAKGDFNLSPDRLKISDSSPLDHAKEGKPKQFSLSQPPSRTEHEHRADAILPASPKLNSRPLVTRRTPPLFEVSGPESPSYQSWAQKAAAAEAPSNTGWTVVAGSKSKRTGDVHRKPLDRTGQPEARWIAISGLRANISLSEVTEPIETGPLVAVTIEKPGLGSSATAHVAFLHSEQAKEFLGFNDYHYHHCQETIYGPGVEVKLGPYFNGPENLSGMVQLVPERRRITIAGSGLFLTKDKVLNFLSKKAGISSKSIVIVHVFNVGNATVIFADIASARRARNLLLSAKGEWDGCKVDFSHDPCEKPIPFLQKAEKQEEPSRRELIRRAYQKATRG